MTWIRRSPAGLVLLVLSCSSQLEPDPRIEEARTYVKEVTGDDLHARVGGLRVTVSSAVSDGRYLRFAGRVENRFAEEVEGIRYTVRILVPGAPPRVAETFYREVRTRLAPGDDKILRLEIENPIHASASSWGYDVEADPVRLGGEDVPPPAGWP